VNLVKGRIFFSEEKKQKTFIFLAVSRLVLSLDLEETKVFCFFFFKKEVLASTVSAACWNTHT
jgi:hypothetical protein